MHWFWFVPQGRNAAEQVKMIKQVEMFNSSLAPELDRVTVSVEIEKTREPLFQLFPHGDVVRLSRPDSLGVVVPWFFFYYPVYYVFPVPPHYPGLCQ